MLIITYLGWYMFGKFLEQWLIPLESWYKRSEFGIRAAIFFSAATVSGAFGGLLAVSATFCQFFAEFIVHLLFC